MQIHEIGLPKKKLITEDRTYRLWESVGRKIVEAQLTPAQIQQVFQQVEQGATAAGGNRTAVGQVKDVGSAVNQAWEQLKSKVQNSGPIKNVDAAYDQAAEKLKQATGGDAGVMQYVEKYRAFAKAHPIAQSLIYAALIAAAGISGAGVGGAAALGLLKMTDKLLQGEKFSSAAYTGAKTGAIAYGASLLNDLLAGRAGVTTSVDDPEWDRLKFQGDMMSSKEILTTTNGVNTLDNTIQSIVGPNTKGEYLVTIVHNYDLQQFVTKTPPPSVADESLRESQVRKAFYVACGLQTQLNEGVWDSIKGAAGKAAGAIGKYVQTKGHNLTTVITVDKLMNAWRSAGSPTDSKAVAKVMRGVGVDDKIINKVISAVLSPAGTKPAPAKQAPTNSKAPPTGGAGAFNQMAQQATAPEKQPATQTSSTGGTIQRTSTGLVHRANPNNPNMAYKESYVKYVAESWEDYKLEENFMTNLAKAAGGAVKGAVGGAVQGIKDKAGQIGAQLKDPKAWVSTPAATAAKGGAQLKQQTARYAQQLAGEWAQQSKALVDAEAKAKMAGAKEKAATKPAPGAPPAPEEPAAPKAPGPKMADLPGTVNKATADNPNKQDQSPYIQTRSGYGTGSDRTKFAKHDQSAAGAAERGINAMIGGGQKKPAPVAPSGGAGAFGQMAQTVTTPAATKPTPPATGGAGAFGQMAQTATTGTRTGKVPSTPAGTTPPSAPEEPISIGGQKLNPKKS